MEIARQYAARHCSRTDVIAAARVAPFRIRRVDVIVTSSIRVAR
jgi:hypothetical protein